MSCLLISISCVVIKIIIGVNLVSFATQRRAGMEDREQEDKVNDFGRDPIGEGKDERVSFNITVYHSHLILSPTNLGPFRTITGS